MHYRNENADSFKADEQEKNTFLKRMCSFNKKMPLKKHTV